MKYLNFFILSCLVLLSYNSSSYGFSNSKDWCLPKNKYQRNIPFHKLEDGNKCPSNTYAITDKRALKILLFDYGGYINKIIESGDICKDTYKNHSYLRSLIKDKKNLDCKKILQNLAEKKSEEAKQKAIAANSPSYGMYSTGEMSYSCKENTSKNYRAYTWKFNANLFKNSVNGTHTFYRSALKRDLERTFSGYIDMGKLYIKSKMNDVVPQKKGDRIKDRMKKIGYTINFKNLNLNNKNLKQVLFEGVEAAEGGRTCILKLVKLEEQKQKITKNLIKKFSDNEICSNAITFKDRTKNWGQSIEFVEEAKNRGLSCDIIVAAQEAPKTELSQNKAKEDEARKKALAEKEAKEEAAKQKALLQKKAKALAKKKAEELAKQKVIAEKKAKEDKARKEALAKEKAEELAKQKAIAAKKAEEEELKQKVLNEKIQKIKDEAKFIVATLKEYVTKDTNKLDILEVSELLENYNSEIQKGWSDTTIRKYEELYDYVQKDEGFIDFSADKKSKQLAAYNKEIIQLREYLTTSQSDLKAFITKNLGSNNAKKALKLAKETKQILRDFDITKAMSLKNNISTWKAMNGVAENKKYTFKILIKELNIQNNSNEKNKSDVKTVIGIRSSDALNTSPVVDNDEDGTFKKGQESNRKANKKKKKRFDFSRDPKDLKMYRFTHHSFGTVGRQTAVFCHYSNGRKDPIGLTLWRKEGCHPYVRDYPNN